MCYSDAAASADVLYTVDGGTTWTACATQPFANAEHISCGVYFELTPAEGGIAAVNRMLVARATADLAAPPEVAYCDDGIGTLWTPINVGLAAQNGEDIPNNGCMWYQDYDHIWVATDAGGIWISTDQGLTWTEQTTTNTNSLFVIRFYDRSHGIACGVANTVLWTEDGGTTWNTMVGPTGQGAQTIMAAQPLDAYRWWVGFNDGTLWYTNDGAATWFQRTFVVPRAASYDFITAMDWIDEYFGSLSVKITDIDADGQGVILRTVNGGQHWEAYPWETVFDAALSNPNGIYMCDRDTIYATGQMIGAVTPVALAIGPSPA